MSGVGGQAAIVGIGATEFSKDSGRSEMQLALEATKAALADAGIAPGEVDGMVTYNGESSMEIEVARGLGVEDVRFMSSVGYGGGASCATMLQGALAIATGLAEVVICWRSLNERSGFRFGQGWAPSANAMGIAASFNRTFGLHTPGSWVAMAAQRYMYEFGATSEDFGRVAVAVRRHASTNPAARFYGQPITLEDHQNSRWIVEPLHLLDCCQESDGACAFVMTSVERARDLPHPPAVIRAAAQGFLRGQHNMTSYYRDSIVGLPEVGRIGRQLWEQSGLTPDDIQTAMFYDHFTPFVLIQLEEFGFCGRGEAPGFIADGAIELGGRLPINPHGGLIGEAYIHGANNINEAVRQLRGDSVNQLSDVSNVLVSGGTGVPTSAVVLGADA